jgi:hypothetical protein
MFQRMIDDFKDTVANSARLTSLAAAMALALFIAMSFLCAAAFVYVLQTYGPIQACLTGAAAFLVVTMIVAACYMARRKRIEEARAAAAKSAMHSALADPMLVATGIQLIRAIGIKRLIPILAVGGLALGFLASRGASGATDDESSEET